MFRVFRGVPPCNFFLHELEQRGTTRNKAFSSYPEMCGKAQNLMGMLLLFYFTASTHNLQARVCFEALTTTTGVQVMWGDEGVVW